MPSVPTPGKNEQSLPGASAPRRGPGPQTGCSCSSFEPATRCCPSRLTAIAGTADEHATPEMLASQDARLKTHGIAYERLSFNGAYRATGL